MKFTTLLPLADNSGNNQTAKVEAIIKSLAVQFGGCSSEGIVNGVWIDNGVTYSDSSIRVSVVCDNNLYEIARDRVIEIGRELGQLAMYFEVQNFDGVQFLRVE